MSMDELTKKMPVGRGFTVGSLVQFETKSNHPGKIHARWAGFATRTRCGLGVPQVGHAPEQWTPANGGYPCRRCFPIGRTYSALLRNTRDLIAEARLEAIEVHPLPKEDDNE